MIAHVGVTSDVLIVEQISNGGLRRMIAYAFGQRSAVRVCVDGDNPVRADGRECRAQSQCGGCLSHAALNGQHRNTVVTQDGLTDACQ
ncbi:Uncharacterised protein [Mycobacteroides abscessus subsp. abscessus]|nr:Uncharacterised protein [Mycobacteroides abscessus subsp. abscessus]